MSAKRELDPEARRLLAELDRIEAGPWPEGLVAYAETLLALAVRCETKAGKAEVYRWMLRELGAVIYARQGRWTTARLDAVALMATTSPALLMRWWATLEAQRRPNLRSMAGALLGWRGKDTWTSCEARHRVREQPWRADVVVSAAPRQEAAVAAAEVFRVLEAGGLPEQALIRLALGDTIAEAARRTGASRQQVYRARRRLLERLGGPVNGRSVGGRRGVRARLRDEIEPGEAPGGPVGVAGGAQREPYAGEGQGSGGQPPDVYERSSIRPHDPPPVRPRPTPLARRPVIDGARPTPPVGVDQGRLGARTTSDRASSPAGRGFRVRRGPASAPVVGARNDRVRGCALVR